MNAVFVKCTHFNPTKDFCCGVVREEIKIPRDYSMLIVVKGRHVTRSTVIILLCFRKVFTHIVH